MTFDSNAKINIGLRIVRKRPDGYHDLETFFQEINLKDTLDIVVTQDHQITMTSDSPDCPTDKSNLAYRAAVLMQPQAGVQQAGCHISIHKTIPVGSGLGGGSSNAATTLCALNRLWQCHLQEEQLQTLGAHLGADVPFFIQGGLALGQGIGEQLTPLPQTIPYWGVLIAPEVAISTATVYQSLNLNLTKRKKITKFVDFISSYADTSAWKHTLYNDLETVVFQHYSHFQSIVQTLYNKGAFFASMSGSGSALFGLFHNPHDARIAKRQFDPYPTFLFEPIYR